MAHGVEPSGFTCPGTATCIPFPPSADPPRKLSTLASGPTPASPMCIRAPTPGFPLWSIIGGARRVRPLAASGPEGRVVDACTRLVPTRASDSTRTQRSALRGRAMGGTRDEAAPDTGCDSRVILRATTGSAILLAPALRRGGRKNCSGWSHCRFLEKFGNFCFRIDF